MGSDKVGKVKGGWVAIGDARASIGELIKLGASPYWAKKDAKASTQLRQARRYFQEAPEWIFQLEEKMVRKFPLPREVWTNEIAATRLLIQQDLYRFKHRLGLRVLLLREQSLRALSSSSRSGKSGEAGAVLGARTEVGITRQIVLPFMIRFGSADAVKNVTKYHPFLSIQHLIDGAASIREEAEVVREAMAEIVSALHKYTPSKKSSLPAEFLDSWKNKVKVERRVRRAYRANRKELESEKSSLLKIRDELKVDARDVGNALR